MATTSGEGSAPAAFLLAGARLVADVGTDAEDVRAEVTDLLTVLDELLRAQVLDRAGEVGTDAVARRRLAGGWHVLGRRRWPSSHRRDLELLLVGPAGVLVVAAVGWGNLRAAGGHLWRGHECADVVLDAVSADSDAVRRLLAEAGLAPAEVTPVVLATGADPQPCFVRGVGVVALSRLPSVLVRRGARLEPPAVKAVLAALHRAVPTPRAAPDAVRHQPALGMSSFAPLAATENDRVMRALDDVLAAAPVPSWATWLHPEQARAAVRPLAGPGLLTGPAGTGKTVVALQRVRAMAAIGRRVLVTSPAAGVAEAARTAGRRIAPHGWDGVDFLALPAVARRVLAECGDGRADAYDPDAAADCWRRAWDDVHAGRDDGEVGLPDWPEQAFWREEVADVLGRGLADEQEYRDWCRVRLVPLPVRVQAGVWSLTCAYRRQLRGDDLLDVEELYQAALARLALPRRPIWDGVVVDDAHESSWAALRLVHALGGDRAEGLLLVADPDRSCRREPATLGEADIDLGDRILAMRQDHRCAELVQAAAAELRAGGSARRPVALAHPRRAGGAVEHVLVTSREQEEADLVAALQEARARVGGRVDQALIVDADEADRWLAVLAAAGIAVAGAEPGGVRADVAVRVCTPEQARGTEFTQVFLPLPADDRTAPAGGADAGGADLAESLREQAGRRRHAAATRARDLLWVAHRG